MRLTVERAATRLAGPLLFLRRTVDVGLGDAVEVLRRRRPRAARAHCCARRRARDDRGARIDVGSHAARHRGALRRRAAVVRPVGGYPGPRVQRRRPGDRRRTAGGRAHAPADRRTSAESGGARESARLHRDRHHDARPDEQPGPRPEAADLLRRRPAARPDRRRDREPRAAARQTGHARRPATSRSSSRASAFRGRAPSTSVAASSRAARCRARRCS